MEQRVANEAHILEKDKKGDAAHLNDASVQLKKEVQARYAGRLNVQ